MTCSCSQTQPRRGESLLQIFGEVREMCPALSKVLLPADAWEALVAAERRPPDAARHASSVLLAFEQGHLAKITAPVHRFLLDGAEPRPNLTPQYREDLQERWLLAQNEAARHERFQKFFGKIAELLLAQWLVEQTWTVRGLGGSRSATADRRKQTAGPARAACVRRASSPPSAPGSLRSSRSRTSAAPRCRRRLAPRPQGPHAGAPGRRARGGCAKG